MQRLPRSPWLLIAVLSCLPLAGCARPQAKDAVPKPPVVLVALPVSRDVTDYEEFNGRTEAYKFVEIRARGITGTLKAVHFTDGSDVQAGQILFEIDPPYYEAEVARTEATVFQADAHLKRLEADYQRAGRAGTKAMSQEEYDKIKGDLREAAAAVRVAQANQKIARINLAYCNVKAPISGRISRRFIDPGNLVKADETILSTIIALDPMYVYFDVDERTLLRIRRLTNEGTIVVRGGGDPIQQYLPMTANGRETMIMSHSGGVPVQMGLADESGYPHELTINFEDNRVDAGTGTLRVRGVFNNSNHLLSPGLFVRVRLPISTPHQALLVAEEAILTDQGQKYVYVIDDDDKVVYRRVQVGRVHGGWREILETAPRLAFPWSVPDFTPTRTEGLEKNERIVVSGLQRAHPGDIVTPTLVEMPERKKPGKDGSLPVKTTASKQSVSRTRDAK